MSERISWLRYMTAHPTAANLLMIIFLFLGLYTIKDLRRETFPDFAPSEVEILVKYPGATPEEVENSVCLNLEDALDGIADIEEVRSEARENLARVVVEMREQGDLDRFFNDIKTEVEAIDDFPDQVEKPTVKLLGQTDMVVAVAVTGPMNVPDLKAYAEQIKDRLLKLPEVSQVALSGFSDHQIRIELPADVEKYGVSVYDVADRISKKNLDVPAGTIETGESEIMVRFTGQRRTLADLEDLTIVSGLTGAEIRLGDIARLSDTFELEEDKIIFNGRRAALLTVNKTKSEDALRVMDTVKVFVDKEQKIAPPGVAFALTRNVSKIVRDRLNMLTINGLEGLILVFLSMWLFFSFRFSFWVSMGLPVSFLGTVFVMQWIGFSLNMMTMVGLLLAIGLLMDDAIVISENVATHLARGKTALDAAVDGTREVASGVLSSFVTTLTVFGPLALLISGNLGKIFWVMPMVLILTLTVSLVEAFLILPNHLAHTLRHVDVTRPSPARRKIDAGLDWVRDRLLGRAVDWAIKWRYLFIGLVLAVFLVSLAMPMSGRLKFQAFPDIDGDVLDARILMPQGTPLDRTEQVVNLVAEALNRVDRELTPSQPKGQTLVQNVNIQYNLNRDALEAGAHVATVSVDLLNAETRTTTLDNLAERWRREVGKMPDVINITFKQPMIGPAGLPLEIRISGRDLAELKKASLKFQDWLNRYPGVLDLSDDLKPGKQEFRVTLKPGASVLGLNESVVAGQLRAAFYGLTADTVYHHGESYDLVVRLAPEDQNSLADLEFFHIVTPDGRRIPLTAVADITPGRGYGKIMRVDSERTVTLTADVNFQKANAAQIVQDTRKRFLPGFFKEFPDISVTFEGQEKQSQTTMASIKNGLIIGLFGIFVILSFQFQSYLEPVVVMTAIPLALIGVIWGHVLLGRDFSMPSMMGFASLAGVVVNDSILLVQFIKFRLEEGMPLTQAAGQASRERFRAVMLTSLTTIMGLFPLMLERSLQAQFLIPLAVAIVFGLIASTLLVLIAIPSLYNILGDLGLVQVREPSGEKNR